MSECRRADWPGRLYSGGLPFPARQSRPDPIGRSVMIGLRGPVAQPARVPELTLGEFEEVIEPRFMKFPAFAASAKT